MTGPGALPRTGHPPLRPAGNATRTPARAVRRIVAATSRNPLAARAAPLAHRAGLIPR